MSRVPVENFFRVEFDHSFGFREYRARVVVRIYRPEDAARGYRGPDAFTFVGEAHRFRSGDGSDPLLSSFRDSRFWEDNLEVMNREAIEDSVVNFTQSMPRQRPQDRAWLLIAMDLFLERYA